MNARLKNALAVAGMALAAQAAAQVTFYEHEEFRGRSFSTDAQIVNFTRRGFNDRASSVEVERGLWEVCNDARFGGHCVVLRPGRYRSLAAMGMNDRISSVRAVNQNTQIDDRRYAPPPAPYSNYPRSDNERLYEARVTAVRAVVGPPEQRCWIEREQVGRERSGANVPAAIAGALIGGVLGHQVGGGRGQDIATAGGAVVGAAVGANIGRDGGPQRASHDVERCTNIPNSARPDYWDVTYNFRGQEFRIQTSEPPGPTLTVNGRGEPRMPFGR